MENGIKNAPVRQARCPCGVWGGLKDGVHSTKLLAVIGEDAKSAMVLEDLLDGLRRRGPGHHLPEAAAGSQR